MLAAARFIGASQSDLTRRPEMNLKAMAVVAGAVVASTASGDAVQWRVQDGGNGHWYGAAEAATWAEAMRSAQAAGGSLATLTTPDENDFVRLVLQATARTRGYIGLEQADGQPAPDEGWHWVTGEPLAWTNWLCFGGRLGCAPDDSPCALPPLRVEDDQANCACIEQTGLWDDLEKTIWCDAGWTSRVALIEWSADCNNDGVVDYGQILSGELPDANRNGIPDNCECLADLNGDGFVAGEDLAAVLDNWGTKGGVIDADVNNDGVVDGSDLSIVLNGWGACP